MPVIPTCLDHLILGASDLDRGIAWVHQRVGVRAAIGGVHPGRGTRNAVLSLGPRCYLEVLAPDPAQAALTWFRQLPQLPEPRLVGWMAHPHDASAFADDLRKSGIACEGPKDSSRVRPDGKTLRWKLLTLTDNRQGLLPTFIEWSADSIHPADDAPSGCRLLRFEAAAPDPQELKSVFQKLKVDVPVLQAGTPQLRASIAGPDGAVDVTS